MIFQGWHILDNDVALPKTVRIHKLKDIADYAREDIDGSLAFCKRFRTAVDIGANYGLITRQLSSRFDNIHSYEIMPNVYNCLEQNIENFNLTNVKLYSCGIGDKFEKVKLQYKWQKKRKMYGSFGTYIIPNLEGDIKVKPLDSFNITDVDYIKIDVEGYEPFVIDGAMKTITKYKPIIFYESKDLYSRYNISGDILSKLSHLGYKKLADTSDKKNTTIGVV